MHEIDPEDLRCSLDCCADEYVTHLDLKRAKELQPTQKPNEQIYELDEPIKIFLFDIPKAQYAKRTMIAATFALCNFILGGICTLCFMFPFEGAYIDFATNLHVPLSTIGMIYHVTPGMMAMCKFFDSSQVLKWIDRRSEHALQMVVAFMFLFTGLGLYAWHGSPNYLTPHAIFGMGTVLANLTAFLTGGLACLGSVPGPKGARGVESFMTNIHALIGVIAYAIYVITFSLGLKTSLKKWLESLFGHFICYVLIVLAVFLFLISLIGPWLRFLANREKANFERKLRNKKKREEKERKKKEKLAKMGVPPEGLH